MPLVWVAPSWHDILFGILIGVASTAGQWIVVLAFRYADASVLAPFSYTQLLWVSILGFLIFGEVPDIWTVIGAAFIVASGLYTAHRERVRRSQLLTVVGPSRRPTRDPPRSVFLAEDAAAPRPLPCATVRPKSPSFVANGIPGLSASCVVNPC